ncbi:hypothetical protein BVI434_1880003 [Burkholderia vietnamiensis]|nr:hypothetical protein BVI434_1880003 [Burkholderia vietnamiensis]
MQQRCRGQRRGEQHERYRDVRPLSRKIEARVRCATRSRCEEFSDHADSTMLQAIALHVARSDELEFRELAPRISNMTCPICGNIKRRPGNTISGNIHAGSDEKHTKKSSHAPPVYM